MKLLNPGPVTLTAAVKAALTREDLCHREQSFADLTLDVIARIGDVYPESKAHYTPVLLTASGTGAVETMLALVPQRADAAGKKTLVVANGVYGERAAQMLKIHGKDFDVIASDWLHGIDLPKVDAALGSGHYAHVYTVHHETTTGRLNDIDGLGVLCKKHNVPMLLDAVSSFGAEDIRFAAWNLEACAGTANKCLHAIPGISFVVAKTTVFAARSTGATAMYLDLFKYQKEQLKGWSPFTQSVQAMFALDASLNEFAATGGQKARLASYIALRNAVMTGLAELGIATFLGDPTVYSSMLVSYRMPANVTYTQLHDHLFAKGFTIYAGQGPYSGQMFRIANMGDLNLEDMQRLLTEIRVVAGTSK
jgi:2-aminoethylphosphonate-pyruvate transaminase